MSAPLPLHFVTSATRHTDLPPARAEVALLGRSNVGKSSLINALSNRKKLAKVSAAPGRTRLLNAFALTEDTQLIDCPGYGYAKASKRDRDRWMAMLEDYLIEREPLVDLLLLVDGAVGPTKADVQVISEMREAGVPLTIVATKADKVKPSARTKRERELAEGCGVASDEVLWTSADKGTGMAELRRHILHRLGL